LLTTNGWEIVHKIFVPEMSAAYHCYDDLNLSVHSKKYFAQFVNGIYLHQKLALEKSLHGLNVCITTSTQLGFKFKDTNIIVPVKLIIEIPGESNIGYYNYSTGQIEEH